VDTVGLSVRIDTLITSADKLPLAAETRAQGDTVTAPAAAPGTSVPEKSKSAAEKGTSPAVQGDNAWSRFWREVWTDLQQMVRVQRIGNADVPLLAPTQAYFLRENLKLRLLTARMALLTRDQATFRGDLKSAQDWIARYFDGRDKAVVATLASLGALQKSEVSIELPDLSATLAALRAVSPAAAKGKQ
jgi:uroporphyrin-III C-methyltransferase